MWRSLKILLLISAFLYLGVERSKGDVFSGLPVLPASSLLGEVLPSGGSRSVSSDYIRDSWGIEAPRTTNGVGSNEQTSSPTRVTPLSKFIFHALYEKNEALQAPAYRSAYSDKFFFLLAIRDAKDYHLHTLCRLIV